MTPSFLRGARQVGGSSKQEETPAFLRGAKPSGLQPQPQKKGLKEEFNEFFNSPEETPFEKGLGTTLRGASSVALGTPGNIAQLIKKSGKGVYDFAANILGLPESPKEEGMHLLPTTSDIEKGFDAVTEGRYAPSEEEKPYYEAAQDITSMFMPGSGPLKAWQRVGIPIAGQLAKEGIKKVGGKETAQELGKMGIVMGLSVASLANGERYAGNLMAQAESMMPSGRMIDATPIQNTLNQLKGSTWYRGADLPSTRAARQLIKAIEENIVNGQIEGKMAIELRKNANELQKNLGAFDVFTKQDKKKAIKLLNEAKDAIMGGLEHYGTTIDPVFWKATSQANQAYSVMAKSKVIGNFIEKHAPGLKSKTAKGLFGGGALGTAATALIKAPLVSAGAASGAIAGIGAIKTSQILYRVMANPKLREYYTNVLHYAAKENSKAMASNLQKLDEALQKEEDQKEL
jgi:hypothetical protein